MRDPILADALRLVSGNRNDLYGDFRPDYQRTVSIFNAITGRDLTPEEGALFMCAVKLSRIGHKLEHDLPPETWRDDLTDLAGYAEGVWQCAVQRPPDGEQETP